MFRESVVLIFVIGYLFCLLILAVKNKAIHMSSFALEAVEINKKYLLLDDCVC